MSPIFSSRPRSLIITYVAIFAALNALADLVPFTPILGVPGGLFRLGWAVSCMTGMLSGARKGAVSSLVGGSIGSFISQVQAFGPFARATFLDSIPGLIVLCLSDIPTRSTPNSTRDSDLDSRRDSTQSFGETKSYLTAQHVPAGNDWEQRAS